MREGEGGPPWDGGGKGLMWKRVGSTVKDRDRCDLC